MCIRDRPRSYKELPVRLAEFGTVYRYEQSGELHGPVSYTHLLSRHPSAQAVNVHEQYYLDVYKRQVPNSARRTGSSLYERGFER